MRNISPSSCVCVAPTAIHVVRKRRRVFLKQKENILMYKNISLPQSRIYRYKMPHSISTGEPLNSTTLLHRLPTVGPQMLFDYNPQKSWPAQLVVKASGTCSPRTTGVPSLRSTEPVSYTHLTLPTKA